MEKKNIDWGNLGFGYMPTDKRYVSNWKDGKWDEGGLIDDPTVQISECAGILHYCQEIFEGLKAYTWEDGSIVTFRPDMNAQRMMDSAARMEMPPFPAERFLELFAAASPFGRGDHAHAAEDCVPAVHNEKASAGGKCIRIACGFERECEVVAQALKFAARVREFFAKAGHLGLEFAHMRHAGAHEYLVCRHYGCLSHVRLL